MTVEVADPHLLDGPRTKGGSFATMPETTPDLTAAPMYVDLVEPTLTIADGRRVLRLTEDVKVTIHPNGRIEITDSSRRLFDVRDRSTRRRTEVHLVPRPDAA